VLVSEGIVGQIIKVAAHYSRVLLITDRNSAVDALVQNSRVRGMVKGNNENQCSFVYALRKDEVKQGELIISSGLDQVFPKGLKIGRVTNVTKVHSQLFQNITLETSVDFDKIEEVLVLKTTR
jgi:rod shape-determining protein MreC